MIVVMNKKVEKPQKVYFKLLLCNIHFMINENVHIILFVLLYRNTASSQKHETKKKGSGSNFARYA